MTDLSSGCFGLLRLMSFDWMRRVSVAKWHVAFRGGGIQRLLSEGKHCCFALQIDLSGTTCCHAANSERTIAVKRRNLENRRALFEETEGQRSTSLRRLLNRAEAFFFF